MLISFIITMADSKTAQEQFVKRLEEDDEFEDFPQDTWDENGSANTSSEPETRLWEESWEDHDDNKDEFTQKLREQLQKNANN